MKITTKEQYIDLSSRGLCGNYLRSWTCPGASHGSGYRGHATIRSIDKASPYNVPWTMVDDSLVIYAQWDMLILSGADPSRLYVQEVPVRSQRRVIQFEAMLGPEWIGSGPGVNLVYELNTTEALRGIRERGVNVAGLMASSVLRSYLSPDSIEMLYDLWDEYPTSIIEATEFSGRCGAFSKNLIIWEIRDF